ncbi:LPXTG cell wall anchor domain-containing protein [Micromonospora sp. KC606]|uniref:LPXTG cell wall anchor domain-containing protein n=1 Tax=Micromonospora sp. KC606 TaxID=2530379 RepID=UPI00104AACE2|nr:LPXTG cell wall anchor domain-containing protein [Micromonospora sp. KC606]TDC72950.1 LPXTG cell wall anchor domain-containing protein [Micromonospora sp. KC606]
MLQRRHVPRMALTATAATALLAFATPAWASSVIPLHPAHKGSTAQKQGCGDDKFEKLPADHDGWHFVLPGGKKAAGDFESLTLTFANGAQTVTVKVPDDSDAYPDFLSAAGNGQVKHAYVFTPAGWTLVDGTATISGKDDRFNLSHTCAGTVPTTSPSPSPSTTGSPTPSASPSESTSPSTSASPSESTSPSESPSPSGSPSASQSTGGGGGGQDDGELPLTGVAATSVALFGLALIGGGVALTVLRRRRDRITFTS